MVFDIPTEVIFSTLLIVGMTFSIFFIIRRVSGWSKLVAQYGTAHSFEGVGDKKWLRTVRVGWVNYNNAGRAYALPSGLMIKFLGNMFGTHKAIIIPWVQIPNEFEKKFFLHRFEPGNVAVSIAVYEDVAQWVLEKKRSYGYTNFDNKTWGKS